MKEYQYFFIDGPTLRSGGRKCFAMAYTSSDNIEAWYDEVDVPAGKLIWNDGLLKLPKREIGVPQVVLQVEI